ncbi:MAG: hypothetical protein HLUCCO02_12740 [Idiomarinaceae bacterium HL-53]|nr:MAG: hypothetical protein HLUCCO02_12740 [Idiomarinaceae bacterium HL-53]CUS47485.1 hypothetical protein Ga0003345_0412 [Idiomarinaceae bacterium HL-53]
MRQSIRQSRLICIAEELALEIFYLQRHIEDLHTKLCESNSVASRLRIYEETVFLEKTKERIESKMVAKSHLSVQVGWSKSHVCNDL